MLPQSALVAGGTLLSAPEAGEGTIVRVDLSLATQFGCQFLKLSDIFY